MSASYAPKISRRSTLQWVAVVAVAATLPRRAPAASSTRIAFSATPHGYGTDPDLNQAAAPWQRIMTTRQLRLAAVLSDIILPASESAPAPSAVGIPDFLDEWISAPYQQQQLDRRAILRGLRNIDNLARQRWQSGFLEIDAQRQEALTVLVSRADESSISPSNQSSFFPLFRSLVVGAYYTTPEGFKDIGYVGNVPIASYPEITSEEHAILEERLSKLGLSAS